MLADQEIKLAQERRMSKMKEDKEEEKHMARELKA